MCPIPAVECGGFSLRERGTGTTDAVVASSTPERQIEFLQQLQRVLSEGGFVASYKYALLHALADLSVIRGDDFGAPLTLTTHEIAEAIAELYWRQVVPFPVGDGEPRVLRQNSGRQASIVSVLERATARYGPSLQKLRRDRLAWNRVVSDVELIVQKMPLWRLQTVGSQQLNFLYPNLGHGSTITLYPGVATSFRAFYQLIIELIRGAWLRYVRRYNAMALGEANELSAFLFGIERASLQVFRPLLEILQEGKCFYCGRGLGLVIDVDHFIPWARYGVDLGHNFLAHASCNRSKSDYLAAEPHLGAWLNRNDRFKGELAGWFDEQGIVHDLDASVSVARWAYGQLSHVDGRVWVAGRRLEPLSSDWETMFAA
jgi:5-methylcytosine-specific restriction endonuclease McrA